MADIFLSYAREDEQQAQQIAHQLEATGLTVWWDRKIPAGMTWRQVIERSLNEMGCMVVLWSRSSVASTWVNEEAEEGRVREKLVPVLIDAVVPPLGFRGIQAADLNGWDGSPATPAFRQLVADLEIRLGRPSQQLPAAAARPAPAVADAGAARRAPTLVLASIVIAALLVVTWVWRGADEGAGEAARTRPAKASLTPPTQPAAVVPITPQPSPASPAQAFTPAPSLQQPTATAVAGRGEPTVKPTEKPKATAMAVEVTARSQSTGLAKVPVARAVRPAHCRDLLERQGLGDALTSEERAFLQKECRS